MTEADISGNIMAIRECVVAPMQAGREPTSVEAATAIVAGFNLLHGFLNDINRIADALESTYISNTDVRVRR